jgi:antirestriction protein
MLRSNTDTAAASVPRIYVACLAAYNNGKLHGAWIDARQSADGIGRDVARMLAASPEPGAEEWAIHDYEGFDGLRLSEWEQFERVASIAAGISEHGPAFTAWLSYDADRDLSDTTAFEDAYRGEWDSLRAYAEDYAEQTGMYDAADKAGSSYVVVDIDMLTRDLDMEMYSVASGHGTVYIFDSSA